MNYTIKFISAKETHAVRHPVLRLGKPIETCVFNGDDLENTFHLGIFLDRKLVGVSSFFKNSHPNLPQENQYQLRGMAILKDYQKKGLGKLILNYGEHIIKKKNTQIIWCNAREIAVNFYKNNGYNTIGKPFNINNIGLHYIMLKDFNK